VTANRTFVSLQPRDPREAIGRKIERTAQNLRRVAVGLVRSSGGAPTRGSVNEAAALELSALHLAGCRVSAELTAQDLSTLSSTPDYFVEQQEVSNLISVLDRDNRVVEAVTVDGSQGYATLSGANLYVIEPDDGTVTVLDTSVLADGDEEADGFVASIPVGTPNSLMQMTASPDGSRIYVTHVNDGTVSVIQTASNVVVNDIDIENASGIATSPEGDRLYVTGNRLTFAGRQATLTVIDTTGATLQLVDTNLDPDHPGVDPIMLSSFAASVAANKSHIYVPDPASNGVTVIDVDTYAVADSISIDGTPVQVAMSSDGTVAYAGSTDGKVFGIDTASNEVFEVITVDPCGCTVTPLHRPRR
jgi:YVTN family beta-propeller protein